MSLVYFAQGDPQYSKKIKIKNNQYRMEVRKSSGLLQVFYEPDLSRFSITHSLAGNTKFRLQKVKGVVEYSINMT